MSGSIGLSDLHLVREDESAILPLILRGDLDAFRENVRLCRRRDAFDGPIVIFFAFAIGRRRALVTLTHHLRCDGDHHFLLHSTDEDSGANNNQKSLADYCHSAGMQIGRRGGSSLEPSSSSFCFFAEDDF